jgi:cold shock CspA family protein
VLSGTVSAFDDAAGLGIVVAADGLEYQFHCVEIADGTRAIAIGESVTFEMLPRFGQTQAGTVTKR